MMLLAQHDDDDDDDDDDPDCMRQAGRASETVILLNFPIQRRNFVAKLRKETQQH